MKVIEEGKKDVTAWWVGQVARCRDCGRKVELEHGDEWRAEWQPAWRGGEVSFSCSNCGNIVTLKRFLCSKIGGEG